MNESIFNLKTVMTSSYVKKQKSLLKVVILGDGGVGKSCFMNRFISNNFDHCFHTVGVEFSNKDIEVNGEYYSLQLWDTAGQERFKSLRTPFYRGSDICILTYDISNTTSFNNLSMWKSEFMFYSDISNTIKFPFIVVGTKIDLPKEKRQVEECDALVWCTENGPMPLIETSAKDAINIEKAFTLAVEQWQQLEDCLDQTNHYLSNTVDLNKHPSTKNSSKSDCCV